VCGEFGARGVDPADDLRGPAGEQLTGGRESDVPAGPLQQLRTGLGLEPSQVVARGRLGVVQFLGRRGDRTQPRNGIEDA
jgi:hypothetical protein